MTDLALQEAHQQQDQARIKILARRLAAIRDSEEALHILNGATVWPYVFQFLNQGAKHRAVIQLYCCSDKGKGCFIGRLQRHVGCYQVTEMHRNAKESLPSLLVFQPSDELWIQGFCRNCFSAVLKQVGFHNYRLCCINRLLKHHLPFSTAILAYLYSS